MAALTFHQALVQAEAQARSTLDVALHERLSAGVALVKNGKVFQTSTGLWQVDSSSRSGVLYSPNGTCQCDDTHFNKPRYCKHQLSVFLAQRTMSLMRQPTTPVVPEVVEPWPDNDPEVEPAPLVETEPTPAPAVPLPEAPASINVRVTIAGRDVQWTLRDTDEDRLATRLERLLARYPVPEAPPQGQATRGQDTTPQCPTHGALKRSTKGKGWYCPQKNVDGSWCKSKGR